MAAKAITENHNGKIVRLNGQIYRIIVANLGRVTLVDAECIFGQDKGQIVNLKTGRNATAKEIRSRINLNLAS